MAHESRVREAVASLRPIDGLMFRLMAQSRGFCEEVLRVLLEDPGLTVVECTPQSSVTNPRGARRSSTPSASSRAAGSWTWRCSGWTRATSRGGRATTPRS